MLRTEEIVIRDAACRALTASRYTFASDEERAAAVATMLWHVAPAPGFLRYSLYRGLEEPTLLELSQWSNEGTRDHSSERHRILRAVAAYTPRLRFSCDWHHVCEGPCRTFVRAHDRPAVCLVVDRQSIVRDESHVSREWIDKVIAALEGRAPAGLCAASFFVSSSGKVVLNFSEWTSAAAYRDALEKGYLAPYGSVDDTPAWKSIRAHPGITREHEVSCYALEAALEMPQGY